MIMVKSPKSKYFKLCSKSHNHWNTSLTLKYQYIKNLVIKLFPHCNDVKDRRAYEIINVTNRRANTYNN